MTQIWDKRCALIATSEKENEYDDECNRNNYNNKNSNNKEDGYNGNEEKNVLHNDGSEDVKNVPHKSVGQNGQDPQAENLTYKDFL